MDAKRYFAGTPSKVLTSRRARAPGEFMFLGLERDGMEWGTGLTAGESAHLMEGLSSVRSGEAPFYVLRGAGSGCRIYVGREAELLILSISVKLSLTVSTKLSLEVVDQLVVALKELQS